MPSHVRPSVAWFAEQMEAKLRENDHKAGWLTQHPVILLDLLRGEVRELRNAVGDNLKTLDSDEVVREAADVANFAMMIADNFGLRLGSLRKGDGEAVRP